MEQRESLERSSSENLAPQSSLNGLAHNGESEIPASGQTILTPRSPPPTNESSPVVDSVLQSDVGFLSGSHKLPELKAVDRRQYSAHASKAERCIGKRICSISEEEIDTRRGASAGSQKVV